MRHVLIATLLMCCVSAASWAQTVGYDTCGALPETSTCCCFKTSHVHGLGATFPAGTRLRIRYVPGFSSGCSGTAYFDVSETKASWTQVTTHAYPGGHVWYTVDLIAPHAVAYVRVRVPSCYADNSRVLVFPEVLSPNGGEVLGGGGTHTVEWVVGAETADVLLEYSTDNGGVWQDIGITENDGLHEWDVPEVTSEQCLVRVTAQGVGVVAPDVSDGVFSIQQVIDDADSLIVPAGTEYTLYGEHTYNQLVDIDGTLYVEGVYGGSAGPKGTLILNAPDIQIAGTIDADGAGCTGTYGPGAGQSGGAAGGGGYGGKGGNSCCGAAGGSPYGTAIGYDIQKGSGGGNGQGGAAFGRGGSGGGAVSLIGETIVIDGVVTADGLIGQPHDWAPGGGSGGGIRIVGDDVNVSGTLSAAGGPGRTGSWSGGGGGGGRIKIFYLCDLDTANATIDVSGASGGGGYRPGATGQAGTYHTESDHPAPFRGYESTLDKWIFSDPCATTLADLGNNPYGQSMLEVFPEPPGWLDMWGQRQGVWSLSGAIEIHVPNRPYSGLHSMKVIWLQVTWAPSYDNMLDERPAVTVLTDDGVEPAAQYPDCVLEEFQEEEVSRNWINTTYVMVLRPNPDYEIITIEGAISVDKVTVETICIPGLITADLNGDLRVDIADLSIVGSKWLTGTP